MTTPVALDAPTTTDTSGALGSIKTAALGAAVTTGASGAVTPARRIPLARALTIDIGRSMVGAEPRALARAATTDTAAVMQLRSGNPQTVTLSAGVARSVVLDRDYQTVAVMNVTGTAVVWFRLDGGEPVANGARCHVLPAAVWRVEVPDVWAGFTTVRLISAGTPTVSVYGVR